MLWVPCRLHVGLPLALSGAWARAANQPGQANAVNEIPWTQVEHLSFPRPIAGTNWFLIQIYNAAGFLMQIEIGWVQRMIWGRKKPVITIKPLAAGRLEPLVGLAFVWATLRPIDMITVGCMTADGAREVIEISMALLEHRLPDLKLPETRSKASLKPAT